MQHRTSPNEVKMRKSLLFLVPLLGLIAADNPRREPPAKAIPLALAVNGVLPTQGISRTQVIAGDPIRGSVVAWDIQGRLPPYIHDWYGQPTWKLTGSDGKSIDLIRHHPGKDISQFDPLYHGEVFIPAGVKPGKYTLTAGPVTWPLEVVTLPKRGARKPVAAGASLVSVQAALNAGNDILLQPGLYEWAKPLVLPAGCTVVGSGTSSAPGAVIRYSGPLLDDDHQYLASITAGGAWSVIDGVTFDAPIGLYRANTQQTAANMTFTGCTFNNANVIAPGPGLVVQDCKFHNAAIWSGGYPVSCSGLFRRCVFDGKNLVPFSLWEGDHNVATIDNEFHGTGRGPYFNAVWGDIRGCLFLGTIIDGVNWAVNAGESHLCEPGVDGALYGFHDNIVAHYHVSCSAGGGSAIQWDGHATGNLVYEVKVDGGWGFVIWGGNVAGNTFGQIELRNGAGIRLRAGAEQNRFSDIAIVNYQPGAWSEQYVSPTWYNQYTSPILWDDAGPGPGNTFTNLYVRGDPLYTPILDPKALTLTNATFNGKPYP